MRPSPAPLTKTTTALFSQMKLVRPLGEGGTGAVWLAHLPGPDTHVAVKTLKADLSVDNDALRDFYDEARALAALDHPGIVRVLEAGVVTEQDVEATEGELQAGSPILVMDFAKHGSLADLEAPLSDGAILRVTADLLGALAHAHTRGVLHRDIKPANVLLHAPADELQDCTHLSSVALADFGIAVGLSQLSGDESRIAGTFSFMAPEHLMGKSKDYGPATDLYAVGCLVWYLVYGKVPHQIGSNSMSDLIDKRLYDEPVQLDAGVDPHPIFHPWLLRILSYDPWSRFGHAADARSALLSHTVKRKRSATSPHRKLPTKEAIAADQETAMEIAPLPMTGQIEVEFAATLDMNAMLGRSHKQTESAAPPSAPASVERESRSTPKDGSYTAPAASDMERSVAGLRRALSRSDTAVPESLGAIGASLVRMRQTPVVGRAKLRNGLVDDFVGVARAHKPALVVLLGAAGVGKSTIVRWLHRELSERGLASTWWAQHATHAQRGSGMAAMLRRHYGCNERAKDEVIHRAAHLTRSEGGDNAEAKLAASLMLADDSDAQDADILSFASPRDRYVALSQLYGDMTSRRPMLLVVDDAQWGPDMCAATAHLLQQDLPLLVVMTWRGTPTSFERTLSDPTFITQEAGDTLRRDADVRQLGKLSPAEQRKVVASTLSLSDELIEHVVQISQGTPLLAVQMVRELVDSGELTGEESGFSASNRQMTAPVYLASLWPRRLSTIARQFGVSIEAIAAPLEMAAIMGRTFLVSELESNMAVLGETLLTELLGTLETHGLGHYDAPTDTFEFAHGLLQDYLVQRSNNAQRAKRLHTAAAHTLQQREPLNETELERLGHHYAEASQHRRALNVWRRLTSQLLNASELHRARAIAARVLALLQNPKARLKPNHRAWGWELMARVDCRFGYRDAALAHLNRARALVADEAEPDLLGHLNAAEGMIEQMAGHAAEAITAYQRALDTMSAGGEVATKARWMYGKACTLKQLGRLDESDQCYELADCWFKEANEHASWLRNALAWSELLVRKHEYVKAEALLAMMSGTPMLARHRMLRVMHLMTQAYLLRARDEPERAIPLYGDALKLLSELESTEVAAPASNLVAIYIEHRMTKPAEKMLQFFADSVQRAGRVGLLDYVRAQRCAVMGLSRRWREMEVVVTEALTQLHDDNLVDEDIASAWVIAMELCVEGQQEELSTKIWPLVRRQLESLPDTAYRAKLSSRVDQLGHAR